jgi:hypothetical protein
MPFTATDPAVGALGGKAYVVGGRPTARTQIFDPTTNSWSQGAPITGATTGVDNTAGTAIGLSFHVIGGFDGTTSRPTHWQFHACKVGELSSAGIVPFVIDDDGSIFGNQSTSLILNNAISGATLNTTCVLYGNDGRVDSTQTISVAPNELKTVGDVVRKLRGASDVQHFTGSLALFGSDVFHGGASVIHNDSGDSAFEEAQPFGGSKSGFIPSVRYTSHLSQATFANLSSSNAFVQLYAYGPAGGETPTNMSLVVVPPHGSVSYVDLVTQLGLPYGQEGQLSFVSSQPLAVAARDQFIYGSYSGFQPVHDVAEAASTVYVPYVEDTGSYATALQISNPGSVTANVTVRFVDGVTGATASRDLPVAINSATALENVVRWVQRKDAGAVTGQRGYIVVTTPQAVTAQARLTTLQTQDIGWPVQGAPLASSFTTGMVRIEPLVLAKEPGNVPELLRAPGQDAGAPTGASRVALANTGSTPATVEITAVNASGSTVGTKPVVITVPAGRQFLTENIGAVLDVPPVFYGWASIRSTSPLLIYHHRALAGGAGVVLPIHGK